jgi:preprotein translocase SecE subunit
MKAFTSYLQNVRGELAHVVWPTPRQAMIFTALVIIISAVVALLITGLDYVFTYAVNYIVSHQ